MADQTSTRTRSGLAWSFSNRALYSAAQLVFVLLLARFISPEEFGVATFILLISELSTYVGSLGYGQLLIRKRRLLDMDVSTAVFSSIVVSAFMCGGFAFLQQVPLTMLQSPRFGELITYCVLLSATGVLVTVMRAVVQRDRAFRLVVVTETLCYLLAYGLLGLPLAINGWGAESVLFAQVVSLLMGTTVFFGAIRHRLKRQRWFVTRSFLAMVPRGLGFAFSELVSWLGLNIDKLFIGSVVGPVSLGLYGRAAAIQSAVLGWITQSLETVMYPTFCQAQLDKERMRTLLYKTRVLTQLMAYPPALLMMIAPESVVQVLLGPRWIEAAPLMPMFGIIIAIRMNNRCTDFVVRATGAVKARIIISSSFAAIMVLAMLFTVCFGVREVAGGVAVAFLLHGLLLNIFAARLLGQETLRFLWHSIKPLGAFVALAVFSRFTFEYGRTENLHPWIQLIIVGSYALLATLALLVFLPFSMVDSKCCKPLDLLTEVWRMTVGGRRAEQHK